MLRRYLVLLTLVLSVTFLAVTAAVLHQPPTKIYVEVLLVNDSCQCNAFDTLELKVVNRWFKSVKPVFWVVTGRHLASVPPVPWRIISGPSTLKPGEEAIYVIKAPSPHAMIKPRESFVVIVTDAYTGYTLGRSRPESHDIPTPVCIRNPRLDYIVYNVLAGVYAPYGWVPYRKGFVRVRDIGHGIEVLVCSTTGRKAYLRLQQQAINPGIIEAHIKLINCTGACRVGLEIHDGIHRIVALLAGNNSFECNKTTTVLKFKEAGDKAIIRVDLENVYSACGWSMPSYRRVLIEGRWYTGVVYTVALFVEVEKGCAKVVFQGVSCFKGFKESP